MENWVIANKLIILIYFIIKYCQGNLEYTKTIVIVCLAYICFNMVLYVVNKTVFKLMCCIAVIIMVLFCSYNTDKYFTVLLPTNILDLVLLYTKKETVGFLSVFIVVPFVDSTILAEYLLICLLCIIIYHLSRVSLMKTKDFSTRVDSLKEKNYNLNKRLERDAEYAKQVEYSSKLEERNKISQEIHDKVGHSIAGTLMQLEALKILIGTDKEKANKIIQNVINSLREGMKSIRATLRNTKPAIEQMGINRMKLVLEEFNADNNIKIVILHEGNLEKITHKQWKNMLENMRECLTNVLKYSKASTVSIRIEVFNKFVKFEVKDNGVGDLNIKKGLGLRGIEERTENIGGKVIIDGTYGFSVITLLPIGEEV